MRLVLYIPLIAGCVLLPRSLPAQGQPGPAAAGFTLQQCVAFALEHTPALQQARLDEEIADRDVKANLAGWLPQVTARANLQRNLKLPVSFVPDFTDLSSGRRVPVTFGVANNANALFQADQTLYSSELLLASRAARGVRLRSRQQVQAARINTVVNVSKAYYDILLTQEQVRVFDEAIIRLEKQLADARSQYEHGTVDKIDYRRATIALGNARSGRRGAEESVRYKKAFLAELMGHEAGAAMQLAYDPKAMEGETLADTLQRVAPAERIEYQQLQTERGLQQLDVRYQQWRLLPTVSAFVNYNLVYQDTQFARLFDRSFPTSVVGVSAAVPLFQGGQRLQQLRRSRLVGKRLGVELENVRQRINTEYEQALATYKSALTEWQTTRQNIAVAREVYDVLKLQYDEGIKTYLELIVAETDLRTTQLDYYNALYRVLAGKLDLQRALGTIDVD